VLSRVSFWQQSDAQPNSAPGPIRAGEPVELGPGDYICYPGDIPHVFEAVEPRTLAVLVSEHP